MYVDAPAARLSQAKCFTITSVRSGHKVDTQWKLFCLVHNIEKLAHHGYAQ